MTNERHVAGKISDLLLSIAKKQVSTDECLLINDNDLRSKIISKLEDIYDSAAELSTLINIAVLKSESK